MSVIHKYIWGKIVCISLFEQRMLWIPGSLFSVESIRPCPKFHELHFYLLWSIPNGQEKLLVQSLHWFNSENSNFNDSMTLHRSQKLKRMELSQLIGERETERESSSSSSRHLRNLVTGESKGLSAAWHWWTCLDELYNGSWPCNTTTWKPQLRF